MPAFLFRTQNFTLFFLLGIWSCNSYPVELTPITGYRSGGEFIDSISNQKHNVDSSSMYGLILSLPYEHGKTYEVYYSHQSSDLNSISFAGTTTTSQINIPITFDYLHIGGTVPISDDDLFSSFLSGGLGFTYISPDFPDSQSDLRASFSIGLGLKFPITSNVAIRLETRGLATLFNNNSSVFCNGGCTLKVNGYFLLQGEVFAGLAIRF